MKDSTAQWILMKVIGGVLLLVSILFYQNTGYCEGLRYLRVPAVFSGASGLYANGESEYTFIAEIFRLYRNNLLKDDKTKELLLSELGINGGELDDMLYNTKQNVIRDELKGANLEKIYGDEHVTIYEGSIRGNSFIVKEITNGADGTWEKYKRGEDVLGGFAAGYILAEGLEVNVNGEQKVIKQAIVQDKVTSLYERIIMEKDVGNTDDIIDMLCKFIDFHQRLMNIGVFGDVEGFLMNYGCDANGNIVVMDVGALNFITKQKDDVIEIPNGYYVRFGMDMLHPVEYIDGDGNTITIDPLEIFDSAIVERLKSDIFPKLGADLSGKMAKYKITAKRVIYHGSAKIADKCEKAKRQYLSDLIKKDNLSEVFLRTSILERLKCINDAYDEGIIMGEHHVKLADKILGHYKSNGETGIRYLHAYVMKSVVMDTLKQLRSEKYTARVVIEPLDLTDAEGKTFTVFVVAHRGDKEGILGKITSTIGDKVKGTIAGGIFQSPQDKDIVIITAVQYVDKKTKLDPFDTERLKRALYKVFAETGNPRLIDQNI